MSTKLKRFFRASFNGAGQMVLPPEIELQLGEKQAYPLQSYLRDLLRANSSAPEFEYMVAKAKHLEWPSLELTKLEVFGNYHAGQLTLAFNQAREYAGGTAFDPDLFIICAHCLYYIGQYEDAYQIVLAAKDHEHLVVHRADYHIVKALICWAANRLEEGKVAIDAARCIEPDNIWAAFNAYAMYFELGDLESFKKVQNELSSGRHQTDDVSFALALVELAQNNYGEGLRLMELRYRLADANRYLNSALFDRPRWQGEYLAGKTLLISVEQGVGDTIMMARYLEILESRGGQLVMEAQPETLSLLASNFPGIKLLAREYASLPCAHFDVWTGAMSLPFLLGGTVESIPGKGGYLAVPPESHGYWQRRVEELARPGRRLRVGLAWSGHPRHRADRRRSVAFAQVAERVRHLNADFFSVQTNVPDVRPENLVDVSDEMLTLADTAALIQCMDLVITVDTSAVHIAGALGKETWLMLPYRYEWRWGLEGEDNNWYHSVKVVRQPKGGDWTSVLNEVFGSRLQGRIDLFGGVK